MGESTRFCSNFVLLRTSGYRLKWSRTKKSLLVSLATVLCGFVSLMAGSALAADSPWPMFQYDAAHTGYVPVTLNTASFSLLWQKTVYGAALNPVTAGGGKVYVSDYGYFSHAGLSVLDAGTGDLLWSVDYGSIFSVNPPSYANGNVYIQTCDNYQDTFIRAYNADTGALVYRTAHEAQWERYYAPTIYDGKVYVDGGEYGGMYCFDAFSGLQNWFYEVNQYDEWTPAVDAKYAYAYTGEYSPNLSVIDRLTGALVFTIADPNFQWNGWSMDVAPVLGATNDVLALHDGRLISFDLGARTIRWQLKANFQGQPSVANGVVYAINSGALNALSEVTGDLLWAWEVPTASVIDSMIVTDSHILLRTANAVYAVNLQTHQTDWSYPASGHLALGEGVLYLAGDNGVLTAISAGSVRVATNHPPVSEAGGAYTSECKDVTTVIQLDGSRSRDPDGDILTFNWSTDCPGSSFDDATSPTPKLTMNCLAGLSCTVTLAVSDGQITNSSQALVTISNHPPVSVAGGPYTAECMGAATVVQLDGSRSYDQDGNSLTFRWSTDCVGASFDDATSPTPKLRIDSSRNMACAVTLVVSDGQYSSSSQASLSILDSQAPDVSGLSATPATLSPANNKLIPVTIGGAVTDGCDSSPVWRIISVTSSDPVVERGARSEPDYVVTGARTLLLRAARSNLRLGRIYRVTLEATDATGNAATRTVSVIVPGIVRAAGAHLK